MSEIPAELRYRDSHEWVRVEDDVAVVGITDHAQDSMGDLVFVEMPEVGVVFAAGDEAGVVESVKAASDIYAPVSGEVVAINEALEDSPSWSTTNPTPAAGCSRSKWPTAASSRKCSPPTSIKSRSTANKFAAAQRPPRSPVGAASAAIRRPINAGVIAAEAAPTAVEGPGEAG